MPFTYLKKSSPGFTAVSIWVMSMPNVPSTGLSGAGAGPDAEVEPAMRNRAAAAATYSRDLIEDLVKKEVPGAEPGPWTEYHMGRAPGPSRRPVWTVQLRVISCELP